MYLRLILSWLLLSLVRGLQLFNREFNASAVLQQLMKISHVYALGLRDCKLLRRLALRHSIRLHLRHHLVCTVICCIGCERARVPVADAQVLWAWQPC